MENSNKTPQWLVNIQENSWNVELFLSIGFIYVFLKLPRWHSVVKTQPRFK
jgi:hypothetical protein